MCTPFLFIVHDIIFQLKDSTFYYNYCPIINYLTRNLPIRLQKREPFVSNYSQICAGDMGDEKSDPGNVGDEKLDPGKFFDRLKFKAEENVFLASFNVWK